MNNYNFEEYLENKYNKILSKLSWLNQAERNFRDNKQNQHEILKSLKLHISPVQYEKLDKVMTKAINRHHTKAIETCCDDVEELVDEFIKELSRECESNGTDITPLGDDGGDGNDYDSKNTDS